MKTFIFLILYFLISISCISQNKKYLNKEDLPLLPLNGYLQEKLVIKDEETSDSLKVFYQIFVDFKYPLNDTTKCITVEAVNVWKLSVTSLITGEKIMDLDFLSEDQLITPYQKHLWNLCNERLNYWYTNQPYETMPYREQEQENRVIFVGTIYIEPV